MNLSTIREISPLRRKNRNDRYLASVAITTLDETSMPTARPKRLRSSDR